MIDAPVEMTSSTSATRFPPPPRRPRPIEQQSLGTPVVIERTGSAIASARWIFGVFWKIR
jgi:hypothetical protein